MRMKPLKSPHMVHHALNYARHGLRVFPVYEPFEDVCTCGNPDCDSTGKHPRNAHGVSEATNNLEVIRQWWKQWPNANIGVSAQDIIVIDVDKDKTGFLSLERLETEFGKLSDTWTVDTGGGGQHFFYRRDAIPCKNGVGIRPGIDIRTNSGYVIAPPSLHRSGERYHWSADSARALAPFPTEWLPLLNSSNSKHGEQKPRFDTASALAGVPEGQRDDTLFKLACKLRNADVPFDTALKLVLEAASNCVPPYSADRAREKVERVYAKYEPKAEGIPDREGLTIEDFYSYMPMHNYIFIPSRDLWPGSSVNARVTLFNDNGQPIKPTDYLDKNRTVDQMTWAPGEPMLIRERLISDGGWIPHSDVACFNLYRPPLAIAGDPVQATEWIAHLNKIYPGDTDHIIQWLAHRVQRPQEKINHALVLGGLQGIGKDTLLEPVKHAVGPWNFSEVTPGHLLGRFNSFIKSVILRISEARDLGDLDRFAFYDHLKIYTAAPPDVLRCDEKNIREYSILNVSGVIITTNHKMDGIYLPPDDRRHYVAWSDLSRNDLPPDYWIKIYTWYENGGHGHVAAYLRSVDLSQFDPKAPPPKTEAFWAIVDANKAPEDAELRDVIDAMGNPEVLTLAKLSQYAESEFAVWLKDRRNSRLIPHRMESVGYEPVRNPGAVDGKWKIGDKRQVVYAKSSLSVRDRIVAARRLFGEDR